MAAFFPVGFDLETSVHRSSSSSDSRGCTPLRRWPTTTGCPGEERELGRSAPTGACARDDWGIGPCDACAAGAVDDTFPGRGAESGHEAWSAYVGCGPVAESESSPSRCRVGLQGCDRGSREERESVRRRPSSCSSWAVWVDHDRRWCRGCEYQLTSCTRTHCLCVHI